MELQPGLLSTIPLTWDVYLQRNITGRERISYWFDFLRIELQYTVMYIAWEDIKYGPSTGVYYGE